jgi:hypothetical protein
MMMVIQSLARCLWGDTWEATAPPNLSDCRALSLWRDTVTWVYFPRIAAGLFRERYRGNFTTPIAGFGLLRV